VGRRLLAWSLTLPLAAAGILVGHELAYRATATPLGGVHAYLGHLPQVVLVLATAGLVGLAVQQRSPRQRAVWPYALIGAAGFVAMEHLERLSHTGEVPWLLTDRTFLLGLALQAPVAWCCLTVARRLADAVTAEPGRRPPQVSALFLPLFEPGELLLAVSRVTAHAGRGPPRLL